jgi:hypothetical protein
LKQVKVFSFHVAQSTPSNMAPLALLFGLRESRKNENAPISGAFFIVI